MTDNLPREYILRCPDWRLLDMCESAMLRLAREEYLNPDGSEALDAFLWAEQTQGELLARIGGGA